MEPNVDIQCAASVDLTGGKNGFITALLPSIKGDLLIFLDWLGSSCNML